jgi:hypothetical protein
MATMMLLRYMGEEAGQESGMEATRTNCPNFKNNDRLGALLFEKEKEKASDRWPIPRPI